jgi:hypothetical protein
MKDIYFMGRKHKGQFRQYEIMTTEEANNRSIKYQPWREAIGGEWCVSDDGYVTQVIATSDFAPKGRGKTKRLVILPYARAWTGQKHLSFMERHRSGNYHETGRKDWATEEARKARTKNAVKLLLEMMMQGRIKWHQLGMVYRADQRIPAATVRRLFNNPRIKQMIEEELHSLLLRDGITQEGLMKLYIKATIEGRCI